MYVIPGCIILSLLALQLLPVLIIYITFVCKMNLANPCRSSTFAPKTRQCSPKTDYTTWRDTLASLGEGY